MDLTMIDFGGGNAETVSASDSLLGQKNLKNLVQQVLTASMASGRQGTRAQKNRASVRHTTKKMYRQKGTGRARAGHSSSPIRRGGGRAFPSLTTENFQKKVNRKMFRLAMAVIFSQLAQGSRLKIVRSLELSSHRTADFVNGLLVMEVKGKVLLIDSEWEEDAKVILASRNVPRVDFLPLSMLLPTNLVNSDVVILTERALRRCEELWG